jgi:hypothetical protein
VLPGSTVTFQWSSNSSVTEYQIAIGTYGPGYYNIYSSPGLTTNSTTVSGIPTDGKPVYVTLRYRVNGLSWQSASYTYTAASLANPPAMTSPAPGSILPGSTVTFQWSPNSAVTAYSLSLGTYGLGYYNLYNSPALSASTTSLTVPNIPTNGKPVYVNLSYTINGAVTKTINYTYTAATTP